MQPTPEFASAAAAGSMQGQRPAAALGGPPTSSISPPATAAAPKPPGEREFSTDVLNIANVDVDAEQNTLMADLARPAALQPGALPQIWRGHHVGGY